MNTKIFLLAILLFITSYASAQDRISLTEYDKVKEYLALDEVQYNSIKNIIQKIESTLEEDQKIINGLRERIKNDDEPGFLEKIKVKRGRDGRISRIYNMIKIIENKLQGDQKEKFKNIIKPELHELSKEEIFGTGN